MPYRVSLLLALLSIIAPSVSLTAEPNREPPLEVTVEIDGQALDTAVGKTATITLDGKSRTVKLTAKPTRQFARAGVNFRYPSHFTYSFDGETPGVAIYTIEGSDAMVMVQSYSEDVGTAQAAADGVLQYLRGAYGDSLVEEKDVSMRLDGVLARGRRVTVQLAGEQLRQEIYPIEKACAVLMFQTPLDDRGVEPEESKVVRKLLTETFKADRTVDGNQ